MRMGVLVVWRWWIMLTCYCGPWIIHHPQRCMWYWPCRMVHSSMWYINYTPKAMTSWWLTFFVHISNLCWEKYEPSTSYSQFVCTLLWSRKQQMQVIWVLGKSLLFAPSLPRNKAFFKIKNLPTNWGMRTKLSYGYGKQSITLGLACRMATCKWEEMPNKHQFFCCGIVESGVLSSNGLHSSLVVISLYINTSVCPVPNAQVKGKQHLPKHMG